MKSHDNNKSCNYQLPQENTSYTAEYNEQKNSRIY